jgi:hypothetical protein
METISFALGVTSVLGAAICTTIIWVAFRVKNLTKENEDLRLTLDIIRKENDTMFYETNREFTKRTEETYRHFEKEIEVLYRQFDSARESSNRYTDSRIDKLIDSYFIKQTSNTVNDVLSTTKQIIKG